MAARSSRYVLEIFPREYAPLMRAVHENRADVFAVVKFFRLTVGFLAWILAWHFDFLETLPINHWLAWIDAMIPAHRPQSAGFLTEDSDFYREPLRNIEHSPCDGFV
jgi:hypothetical protein